MKNNKYMLYLFMDRGESLE